MLEKEPQKPPEHTSEHVISQNFLGVCPQTPSPMCPTFIFVQGLHNPLGSPVHMHHMCVQLIHMWDQKSLASIIPQALSSLQVPRNETAHSVISQNLACQDQQLKSNRQANCLSQPRCPGSTHFVAVKEWQQNGWKFWLNIAFCLWNLYDDGQSLPETSSLWLHVYSNWSFRFSYTSLIFINICVVYLVE